tara:strand:+ start:7127 stop:7381 length:255 start_codon:yes stop_codon:yes gene_type:complete
MLTQDQLNSIGGDSVFEFETCIGIGGVTVIVRMSYEYDASGIYNETIDNIRTLDKVNIMYYLEEETIDQLCIRGCMLLSEKEIY